MAPNSQKRHEARKIAVQSLYHWQSNDVAPEDLYIHFPNQDELNEETVDLIFLKNLMLEVPRASSALDEQLTPFLDRPIKQLGAVELAILRLASFELLKTDTPTTVILNEAIELAKTFGGNDSYKFINGVLDRLANSHAKK